MAAFKHDAAKFSVPFEYPPHGYNIPDGYGITQLLANAVLGAHQRCDSIYTVASVPADHGWGWALICDHKQEAYVIKLVGHDWKLLMQ
jgi:hypothetical protein